MKINKTFIEDLLIIEPQLVEDDRGFFYESYNKKIIDKFYLATLYKNDDQLLLIKNDKFKFLNFIHYIHYINIRVLFRIIIF